MTQVSTPLSLWIQLASAAFVLSGLHGDLLVIRFFLFLAYILLVINAALGSPLWPDVSNLGSLPVDSLVWGIIGIYVHGTSLVNLLLDERRLELGDDEAALWRMFYRTGGLSVRLFKEVVSPYVHVVEFPKDSIIPTENYFYIVYKGQVSLRVYEGEKIKVYGRKVLSGEMFDLKYMGMFTDASVFTTHRIECTAMTDTVKLFRFSRTDMKKIAHHNFAKGVWQSLLINNLSFVVESLMEKRDKNEDSEQVDKIFAPLETWEMPKETCAGSGSALRHPLAHFWQSARKSFSPPWPFGDHLTGMRQTLLAAPAQQPSPDPQRAPLYHHRSESSTVAGTLWTLTSSLQMSTLPEAGSIENDEETLEGRSN